MLTNDYRIIDHETRGRTMLAFPYVLLKPHERQAKLNHCGQSLEEMRKRGGLSPQEMVAILEDRPWSPMTFDEAYERLKQIRAAAEAVP